MGQPHKKHYSRHGQNNHHDHNYNGELCKLCDTPDYHHTHTCDKGDKYKKYDSYDKYDKYKHDSYDEHDSHVKHDDASAFIEDFTINTIRITPPPDDLTEPKIIEFSETFYTPGRCYGFWGDKTTWVVKKKGVYNICIKGYACPKTGSLTDTYTWLLIYVNGERTAWSVGGQIGKNTVISPVETSWTDGAEPLAVQRSVYLRPGDTIDFRAWVTQNPSGILLAPFTDMHFYQVGVRITETCLKMDRC